MVLDMTKPIDRIRVVIGDTNVPTYLSDTEIQLFLDQHPASEKSATIASAYGVLAKMAMTSTFSRVDVLQEDKRQIAKNYADFIKMTMLNPLYAQRAVRTYAGGVSKSDMAANDANPDNNIVQAFKPMKENTSWVVESTEFRTEE